MILRLVLLFGLASVCSAAQAMDPEFSMTTLEIINRWGYPAEEVDVVTKDGYILTMHRIPYGKDGPSQNRPVIFLQHGLEDSSFSWVANLPSQSAAFVFADAGYDVWMGNMRGNKYSTDHISLSTKPGKYWDFSFDEMVKFDLPTMINKALQVANQSSLYYVGHSQGTLTMFSLLSRDSNFHTKIRKFFALAPVGHVKHIKGMFEVLAHLLYGELKLLYDIMGDRTFFPTGDLFTLISEYVCETPQGGQFCDNLMMLIMGVDSNQLNITRTPVYMNHIPSGTSFKNVLHWIQMVRSGELCEYDYGWGNEQRYGANKAPLYDLANDNADVYLFWSETDWLADGTDIEDYLIPTLQKQYVVSNVKLIDFNHVDFLWGSRATGEVYFPIMEAIQKDLHKWAD